MSEPWFSAFERRVFGVILLGVPRSEIPRLLFTTDERVREVVDAARAEGRAVIQASNSHPRAGAGE